MKNVLNLALLAATFEGITEDSTEAQVLEFIQSKDTAITDLEAKITDLEARETALNTSVEALKKSLAENKVDSAISAGKISKEKRDSMVSLELANEGSIDTILEAIPAVSANIEKEITNQDKGREAWTFEEWSQKDSKGLEAMKNANPVQFNRLFVAQYGEPSKS